MYLYFIRHGQSEANVLRQISNRGYVHGLTEKGRAQAAALAENLRGKGIGRIYTSPLKRAVETAQVLGGALGIQYEITGALREFDCGIAEGGADINAWDLWHWVWDEWHVHGHYDSKIDGGESCTDLRSRLYPFVNGLAAEGMHRQENYALIGHGGLYSAVLPELMLNCAEIRARSGDLGLPNSAYVLAQARENGLACLQWGEIKFAV